MVVVDRNVFVDKMRREMVFTRGRDVQYGGDSQTLKFRHAGSGKGVPDVQMGENLHRVRQSGIGSEQCLPLRFFLGGGFWWVAVYRVIVS